MFNNDEKLQQNKLKLPYDKLKGHKIKNLRDDLSIITNIHPELFMFTLSSQYYMDDEVEDKHETN